MNKKELQNKCFRFTEKILYGYKDIEEFIENTEKKLNDMKLEENTTTVGTINYDSIQVSPTFNISRITERKALNKVEEETELKIELYKNIKVKREIDQVISNLSSIHRDVIRYRYIEGLQWLEITERMNYEDRHLRNKKNEAVKSIARKLFGVKVFRDEEPTLFDMLCI